MSRLTILLNPSIFKSAKQQYGSVGEPGDLHRVTPFRHGKGTLLTRADHLYKQFPFRTKGEVFAIGRDCGRVQRVIPRIRGERFERDLFWLFRLGFWLPPRLPDE